MYPTVDIIVPAYSGEAETRSCLASVFAASNLRRTEVVVIDDASPEPALSAWLRQLAAAGQITLLEHRENRGFVASANEGMQLHPERDVVLLNSDTEVAGDWMDRLIGHANRDRSVGTVTPFSSNATICSYPRTLQANELPEAESTATVDSACRSANAERAVHIPTAVGFCMYIPRRCLDRVGLFDEARYGRGYGEEVDFCMRASRAGFTHVLAGDVYVRHIGEVSFGGAGVERRLQAQATVDALYPEFQERLRAFIPADPARLLRRRVDLERLRRSVRPRELFIDTAIDPAKKQAVEGLAAGVAHEAEPLVLTFGPEGPALRWLRPGEEFALYVTDAFSARFVAMLRQVGIARVILPGADSHERNLHRLGAALGCPTLSLEERIHAGAATPPAMPSGAPWGELPEKWLRPHPMPRSFFRRMVKAMRGP